MAGRGSPETVLNGRCCQQNLVAAREEANEGEAERPLEQGASVVGFRKDTAYTLPLGLRMATKLYRGDEAARQALK